MAQAQSLAKRMYMIFFAFYQLNCQQFQLILGGNSYLWDGAFYRLRSEKENTAKGRYQLSFFFIVTVI